MSAIQPITGRFKSRVFRDIIGSTILGTFFGYIWWYGFHVPSFKKFTEYNSQILQEIKKENAEFLASLAQVSESEATEEPVVSLKICQTANFKLENLTDIEFLQTFEMEINEFYDLENLLKTQRKEEYFIQLLKLQIQQEQLKLYLCGIITKEFSEFPNCQELALNRIWDLCEDDDFSIRKQGILALRVLAFKFPSRIADVLWQFMQSQLEEEVLVVKQTLAFMLSQFTMETLDAFFHQTSINENIRDKSIDFLIENYPKNHLKNDTLFCDKFIKNMPIIQFKEDQVLKIYKFLKTFDLSLEVQEKMVSYLLQRNVDDFKQVLIRANVFLAFFKQGVSSTSFLEALYGLWKRQVTQAEEFAQVKNLHLLMLFADLITFQKVEGEYVLLFPELLTEFYSDGLKDEESCGFLMAEPILYCIYQCVCSSPDKFAGNDGVLGVMRRIFASSQTCRDKIYSKLQNLERHDIKSLQIIKDIKQLKKQHRAAQNIFNMSREILKPQSARRRLFITPSWKPEPVGITRAPSDITLVSGSSTLKRPSEKADVKMESPTKKKKSNVGKKNANKPMSVDKSKKQKVENRQKPLGMKGIIKSKQVAKAEASKSIRGKPRVLKSSLSIAGTATNRIGITHPVNYPRHVSLLRPSAASAGAALFQKATGAVVQSVSEVQPSGRIVTFGLRQT